MTDFLLELRSEEIPARMQAGARENLAKLFAAEIAKAGLVASETVTYATPRRLTLIARGLPDATEAVSEELKGPKTSAPPQALEGFLRKTGLTRDQLTERDGILYAVTEKPGRATADVLAEAIPAIIRAFSWPKSMRWGEASRSPESLRWVRPLHGIVALFGEDVVPCKIAGVAGASTGKVGTGFPSGDATIKSSAVTKGHRFHHPDDITIGSAADYVEKLRACHVIVDHDERAALIRDGAAKLAADAGLALIEDEGLVAENAGLTEWPVPLLGRFDEAFLDVPPEVIQLTARVNQKYFVLSPLPGREGPGVGDGTHDASAKAPPTPDPSLPGRGAKLANAFICVANIVASDDGAKIVEGNRKVLAARLSDARFFYDTDLKTNLDDQLPKLEKIVFHEKLGTLADKVDRVAKLARWLVEEGIVKSPSPPAGEGRGPSASADGKGEGAPQATPPAATPHPDPLPAGEREQLAALAERAARLAKADLVTGMVGEFPELQGVMGGYYAAAQGEAAEVAAAIRDHYKPVGQGDEVPTDPVTVAVSLADKLDTIYAFFMANERPSGSRDPYALRRAGLGILSITTQNSLELKLVKALEKIGEIYGLVGAEIEKVIDQLLVEKDELDGAGAEQSRRYAVISQRIEERQRTLQLYRAYLDPQYLNEPNPAAGYSAIVSFLADRLKVQQREAGVRHDLIDAVFALGGEDDLVRLLARVRALQAFVATDDGANLLAGNKRAANILKKEGYASPSPLRGEGRGEGPPQATPPGTAPHPDPLPSGEREQKTLSYTPEKAESDLIAALDAAEPIAAAAVAAEEFEGAMAALATLRAPIDAFFDGVTVNDPDPAKRAARLALLARVRDAVHTVADFSKIEG